MTGLATRLVFFTVAAGLLTLFTRLLAVFCNLADAPLLAPVRCPLAAACFTFAFLAPDVFAPVILRRAGARADAVALAPRFLALCFRAVVEELFAIDRFCCDLATDEGFDFVEFVGFFFFGDFLCAAMAKLSTRAQSPTPTLGPTILRATFVGAKNHTCTTLAMPEAPERHPLCRPAWLLPSTKALKDQRR